MLSIEMYKGIQERDEVIKELTKACEVAVLAIREVISFANGLNWESDGFKKSLQIVQQALNKANPGNGEEKG